jgi:hypothetical protein
MSMKDLRHILMLAGALILLTHGIAAPVANIWAGEQGSTVSANPAPTPEQIRSLVDRIVENQHRNDRAIEEFERIEHVVSRRGGGNSPVISDVTNRVMPSGTGTMRLRMAQDSSPVSPDVYQHELEFAVSALEGAIHPNHRALQDLAKFERRRRERVELVDATAKAFNVRWAGRETAGSRTLVKLLLDPDPNYKPTSRLTAIFEHVHAVLWVDESQAEIARLEGDITSDITVGGGIVGKVYHGGRFVMEQAEVAPGIWLPTLYIYDVDGRKFLFGFGVHERTDFTRYRHVGLPTESVEIVRNELNKRTD